MQREMSNTDNKKILKQTDLYEILPFKKTKILQLLRSGELPVVKVGKDYITTYELIEKWIKENVGGEIFYVDYSQASRHI